MLNRLPRAQMPNQKARDILIELKKAAGSVEAESINLGGFYYITVERLEGYKERVKKLIRTYNRFIKAMEDDGVV